jgi:TctA family transporter
MTEQQTFFGMDAFSLDTDQATRRLFWTVFAVLSGVTYVLAAVGLFGFHLVATKRKQLTSQITSKWNEVLMMLKERRRDKNLERNSDQA